MPYQQLSNCVQFCCWSFTDSEVLNLEMLSNTSVSSTQSVKEWGFLQTNNASLLAALVGQTLTIFKLQLNQTDETLSHVATLQGKKKTSCLNLISP